MRICMLAIQAVLIFLIASVSSLTDNCVIPWLISGNEVEESDYLLQMSIKGVEYADELSYFPDVNYDLTIKHRVSNYTFINFYFIIYNENETNSFGSLEIRDEKLSKFNTNTYCTNRIIDGPISLPKTNLTIGWRSPSRDSGCIQMKVYIRQTDRRYHVVNKTVCEDERIKLDDPGSIIKDCGARVEGKYQLTFEGLWSKYYHPKHFPKKDWVAFFPSVIGFSHHPEVGFWEPYTLASPGLANYATTGNTVGLEMEMKQKERINTLIKFRGANFQNKTGKSLASFRVSNARHVVSLISRLDPSPDWFIGVHSMELCQSDCSWVSSKTLNMYAFDAGVRDGIVYEPGFNMTTHPQDIIQSLNMTWPPSVDNLQSPFYNSKNNTHEVRPLAKIHLKLVSGFEKICKHEEDKTEEKCVTRWTDWTMCTVTCGAGVITRNRTLKENRDKSLNCTIFPLYESKTCNVGKPCNMDVKSEDCQLTEWGEWQKCKRPCGMESVNRTRSYKWTDKQAICEGKFGKQSLTEHKDCGNPLCPYSEDIFCNDALYTQWEGWTPCSVTQGKGVMIGRRSIKTDPIPEYSSDYGFHACLFTVKECDASQITTPKPFVDPRDEGILKKNLTSLIDEGRPNFCNEPKHEGTIDNGKSDNSHRFYFDPITGTCQEFVFKGHPGNNNRFTTKEKCEDICIYYPGGKPKLCQVSQWGQWEPRVCSRCDGRRTRMRKITIYPNEHGGGCPPLIEEEKCQWTDACRPKKKTKSIYG